MSLISQFNAINKSLFEIISCPLFDVDSYKPSHWLQLPPLDTIHQVSSYIEPRKGSDIVVFGWRMIIAMLAQRVTAPEVEFMDAFCKTHGIAFNKVGWMLIVDKYNGYVPLVIKGLPEGTVIKDSKTAVARIDFFPEVHESGDIDELAWVVQWIETLLLRIWYPSTVATISRKCKSMIRDAMIKSCDNLDGLDFKLHDFGSRGASSVLSAAMGAAAHLVNFKGSDTIPGILMAMYYYDSEMAGYSINASEHGTMTPWINMSVDAFKGETAAYNNMIDKFGDGPIFACVSDSRDIEVAVRDIWGGVLADKLKAMNATLVIRPDSDDPLILLPKLLDIMAQKFGYTTNTKGYKVINKHRLIQGDGVTIETLPFMLKAIMDAGYSIENVAFGMGGGLLQKCDRDTFGWAMKVSYMMIGDQDVRVFKCPAGQKDKASKSGILSVYRRISTGELFEVDELEQPDFHMDPEFEDAFIVLYSHRSDQALPYIHWPLEDNLEVIRERAAFK